MSDNLGPKGFVEQFNDAVAPITRAWTQPKIEQVVIKPGDAKEDEITATVVVKLKRRAA